MNTAVDKLFLDAASNKHLDWLESEAIHIMREVAAECTNPALLFSGGKDSVVLLRLAEKAFRPGKFPFPLVHIDTGHNFEEVITFRDKRVAELGERLIVGSVEDSIKRGTVRLRNPQTDSRNAAQAVTPNTSSTPVSAARAVMKKKRGPRSASFRSATNSASGIRRRNDLNSGTCTTRAFIRAKTCGCFRSRTGPNSTCGSTSRERSLNCRRFISRTSAR
jgi:hypothetical protein